MRISRDCENLIQHLFDTDEIIVGRACLIIVTAAKKRKWSNDQLRAYCLAMSALYRHLNTKPQKSVTESILRTKLQCALMNMEAIHLGRC